MSFVGGRDTGGQVAPSLADLGRRHILEQEGLNCWGVWDYSDWATLTGQIRKTYDYAKQRYTAYPRFVVQRSAFGEFLAAYLPAVFRVCGSGTSRRGVGRRSAAGARLRASDQQRQGERPDRPGRRGGVEGWRATVPGALDDGRFLQGQDISAYMAPGGDPHAAPLVAAVPR